MRKGEPWGRPVTGPPDVEVRGDDATSRRPCGARPASASGSSPTTARDLAPAPSASTDTPTPTAELPSTELPVDGLARRRLAVDGGRAPGTSCSREPGRASVAPDRLRCVAPDAAVRRRGRRARRVRRARATSVVVANGQFLRGLDVVPRGHPGDGRCEVQVYALAPSARAARCGGACPAVTTSRIPTSDQASGRVGLRTVDGAPAGRGRRPSGRSARPGSSRADRPGSPGTAGLTGAARKRAGRSAG